MFSCVLQSSVLQLYFCQNPVFFLFLYFFIPMIQRGPYCGFKNREFQTLVLGGVPTTFATTKKKMLDIILFLMDILLFVRRTLMYLPHVLINVQY